jgi:hypothetical protein
MKQLFGAKPVVICSIWGSIPCIAANRNKEVNDRPACRPRAKSIVSSFQNKIRREFGHHEIAVRDELVERGHSSADSTFIWFVRAIPFRIDDRVARGAFLRSTII